MKKEIAILTIPTIILYLLFSFVNWDINPQIWDISVRGFFAVITFLITGFIYAIDKDGLK